MAMFSLFIEIEVKLGVFVCKVFLNLIICA